MLLSVAALLGAPAGLAWAQFQGIGPVEREGITPGVRASASWSDNILRTENDTEDDVVVEVSPYVIASGTSARSRYRLMYQLRNFWRVRENDSNLFRHALQADGTFALLQDRLGVDASGFMGTTNASASGPISLDPAASFTNTAKVRSFSVSPWYRDRITGIADYDLRYRLTHSGGDSGFVTADRDHYFSADVNGIPSASPWNWRWYGNHQIRQFDSDDLHRRQSGAALYYRIDPALRVFGTVDYEQIDGVRNSDGDDHGFGPGAGFEWDPTARTRVSGLWSKRYYGNIGHLRASHSTRRATMGIDLSRSIQTNADSLLLRLNPASLTGGGFGSTAANPVLDNLLRSGVVLPSDTVISQGLFTDAAVFERRVALFWGLHSPVNSLTATVFTTDRESTNDFQPTTPISGIRGGGVDGGVFSGRLREYGVGLGLQHRLDARSAVDAFLDWRRNRSPSADFETDLTRLRLGYQRQFTRTTTGFAGVQRTEQDGSGSGVGYDENAVYAGVDMRFR